MVASIKQKFENVSSLVNPRYHGAGRPTEKTYPKCNTREQGPYSTPIPLKKYDQITNKIIIFNIQNGKYFSV
jgi:hypothetical protein